MDPDSAGEKKALRHDCCTHLFGCTQHSKLKENHLWHSCMFVCVWPIVSFVCTKTVRWIL